MTKPFSTATPDRAMNPTPAEMDSGMSRNHSATTPPLSAKGTPRKHQQSVPKISEHGIKQNKDQSKRHGNDNLEALSG